MKFTKIAMLIIVAILLISGSGCSTTYIVPAVVLTAALLTSDLEEPTEYKGGAWYVYPDSTEEIK